MQKSLLHNPVEFYTSQPCSGSTFQRQRSGLEHCYATVTKRVRDGNVLDIGCSDGLLLQKLISPERELYGIDMSVTEIQKATTRIPSVNFSVGDIRNIPYSTAYFENLICVDVLEHINDSFDVLRECFRVLKPGGAAFFIVPNGRGRYGKSIQHIKQFTMQTFCAMLQSNGFDIVNRRFFGLHLPFLTYFIGVCAGAANKYLPLSSPLNITMPPQLATHLFVECRKPQYNKATPITSKCSRTPREEIAEEDMLEKDSTAKPQRILVLSNADYGSRGFSAIVEGFKNCLTAYMPDIELTMLSFQPEKYKYLEDKNLKIVQHPWANPRMPSLNAISYIFYLPLDLIKSLFFRAVGKLKLTRYHPYAGYDAAIHINVDCLDETSYGTLSVLLNLYKTGIARLIFNLPFATAPVDMGPFTSYFTRWLARRVFSRVKIVAFRDEVSYRHYANLGLGIKNAYQSADLAFLMQPAPPSTISDILRSKNIKPGAKTIIGFCPSLFQMVLPDIFLDISRRDEKKARYIALMADYVDFLVSRFDATVYLISHVVPDDDAVCQAIYDSMKNKQAVALFNTGYSSPELKGIIKTCDMFIASRMHAAIASTSMQVPTLTIAYQDKYYRLIGEYMGQGDYIVNIKGSASDVLQAEIMAKTELLWRNRAAVAEVLAQRSTIAVKNASAYGAIISDMLKSEASGKPENIL